MGNKTDGEPGITNLSIPRDLGNLFVAAVGSVALTIGNLESILDAYEHRMFRWSMNIGVILLVLYLALRRHPSNVTGVSGAPVKSVASPYRTQLLVVAALLVTVVMYAQFSGGNNMIEFRSPGVTDIQSGNAVMVERKDGIRLHAMGITFANPAKKYSADEQHSTPYVGIPFNLAEGTDSALVESIQLEIVDYEPMPAHALADGAFSGQFDQITAWFELSNQKVDLPWDVSPVAVRRSHSFNESTEEHFPFLISGDSEHYLVVRFFARDPGIYHVVPKITISSPRQGSTEIRLAESPLPFAFYGDSETQLTDPITL